jgi:hypothetical protein
MAGTLDRENPSPFTGRWGNRSRRPPTARACESATGICGGGDKGVRGSAFRALKQKRTLFSAAVEEEGPAEADRSVVKRTILRRGVR